MRWLRGEGSLAGVEIDLCKKYEGNIREQVRILLGQEISAATGIARGMGNARRSQVRENCEYMLVDALRDCAEHAEDSTLRIKNTNEFTSKHLIALLALFGRKRLKSSTIHKYLSSLRRFMTLLGRRYLVPGTEDLISLIMKFQIDVDLQSRTHAALCPLCWSAHVNIDAVLQIIHKKNSHAYFLCCLCLNFGLRMSEVLRLRPHESDKGDHLHLKRGTKGKRERNVPLSSDPEVRAQQRRLVDEAKKMCEGDKYLGFGQRNLKQARKYFEAVLADCGVTRTQLGITLHGLRHEYAVRRFEELTGLPAPVLRQAPLSAYVPRIDAVGAARRQIAEELGHGREQVASAYFGALPILREEQAKAREAASRLSQHGAKLRGMRLAALSVVVRKVAPKRYAYVLFARAQGVELDVQRELAGALKGAARLWLERAVEVRLMAAPSQAGSIAVTFDEMSSDYECAS